MKTNIELVKHAEFALSEKWFYLWGAYGQKATQSLIDSNIKQYPDNEKWRAYVSQAIGKNRVCDCYGLVKSCLWWTDDKSNPKYGAAQDKNTLGAYNIAKEKGALATMPELPGVILYMPGHVGVYCGNGRFIECAGSGKGVVVGAISGGKVTKGSKFSHWFKDVNVAYETKSPEEITVDNAIKDGVITDKVYWQGVLLGNVAPDRVFIRMLLENAHKVINKL